MKLSRLSGICIYDHTAKNQRQIPHLFINVYKCVYLIYMLLSIRQADMQGAINLTKSLNELNIMVEDIDPHIIGITESWANTDITDAELGLTGYVMFRRDRIGRRGGGIILYVKESIQAYEIKLESEADYDEAVWCKIVSGNSKLTIGLVYRSPNINEEDNTKIQNAIKEVSKGNVS